jgi:hypothetical protein
MARLENWRGFFGGAVGTFKHYRRKGIAEMRPWQPGEGMAGISISTADMRNGSPKAGDMIARNPSNWDDQWLVAHDHFQLYFEPE